MIERWLSGIAVMLALTLALLLVAPGGHNADPCASGVWVAQRGHNLSLIAATCHTTVSTLIGYNDLPRSGALQPGQAIRLPPVSHPPRLSAPPASASPIAPPTLTDFWNGQASWRLDTADTGLPVGESDTLYLGGGAYWSYLHASTQSAGVVDSCGAPVEFPGCVTRWVSTDGGRRFRLAEPRCVLRCDSCPCDADDHVSQQQYPRIARSDDGWFVMVYEHGGAAWVAYSGDGLWWERPQRVQGTGLWRFEDWTCTHPQIIAPHPNFGHEMDCMAGGPPGLLLANSKVYVFVGLGQNPAHMGCYWAWWGSGRFSPCEENPLFDGAAEYGPPDVLGSAAGPYFDFRFATSADVIRTPDGAYYMAYEGIRGPSAPGLWRDDQFGLGLARSTVVDGVWEKYPGNPILGGVMDNWGIGHADLLAADGVTVMYTASSQTTRGRYVLAWNP